MADTFSKLMTSENMAIMCGDNNRVKIDRIILHHNATTNKDVAMNTWLASGSAQTSAHYEITPTEIIGCVGENMVAWHAGEYSMNQRSIGIEHVNSTLAPDWQVDKATEENSAKLVADICQRYNIPIDAEHILPHKAVVATACPGGLDVNWIISRARQIAGQSQPLSQPVAQANPLTQSVKVSATQQFKNAGNKFIFNKDIRVDEVKFVNNIWQFANYDLAGGAPVNWNDNGIPLAIVDRTDGGDNNNVVTGAMVQFQQAYRSGTVDAYDEPTQAVAVDYPGYGRVWYSADALANRF